MFHWRIRCRHNNKMKRDRKKEDWAILPNFSTYLCITQPCIFVFPLWGKNNSRYIAEGHIMKWHEECWLKTILKLLHSFLRRKKNIINNNKNLKPFCWHFPKHTIGFPWNNIPMQGLSANSKLHHSWIHPLPCNFPSLWSSDTSAPKSTWFHKEGFGDHPGCHSSRLA